jgi:YidC/Oxa1 family membrane protein insertase
MAIKQQKNQIKQASLAPRTAAIRKKYAGRDDQATKQKMQNEIMDMYKEEHFNPASGCGTLLLQLPVIICLYNVVMRPLRYISNIPSAEIESLKTLLTSLGHSLNIRNEQIDMINLIRGNVSDYLTAAPSLKNAILPEFTVGPFDLSKTPTISFSPFDWLMLIPVLTFIVMVVTQKIMQKYTYQSPMQKDQQKGLSMKIMTWTMPLISVYFEFQVAAAIGVYWIFRNVIQVGVKIVISKIFPTPVFTEEDYKEAERQLNQSGKQRKRELKEGGTKKPVRSLHHIDDEEYLARHAHDFDDEEDEVTGSETTENKKAPAPIKNDEKTNYKEKK